MSFQHEVYPVEPAAGPAAPGEELEEQPLSRQVFVVQELEIRDRLPSSKINKFLYMYTSERMPRRTHSNMVLRAAPASSRAGVGAGPRLRTCGHPSSHSLGLSASPGDGGARGGPAEGVACVDTDRSDEPRWAGTQGLQPSDRPALALCPQLTIKALHVAPSTNMGAPECCLRVSLLPLRLNVDQVSRLGAGGRKVKPPAAKP